MKYKLLGKSGLRVSELCLGTNTFGTEWGIGTGREESRRIFETFVEAGGNFIDTANVYNHGTSERYLGEFIGPERERFVLATKYSMATGAHMNAGGNGRKNMMQAVDASLKRLGTDYIDLFFMHAWDGITPVEEIMRGFNDLVSAGKILYFGISDTPAWVVSRMEMLARQANWAAPVAVQAEYSLVERTPEREILPMARALGMSVLPWYVLGSGVLSGKYNQEEVQGRLKSDSPYLSERNLHIAAEVVKISQETGKTPAQVAINWVRQQHRDIIPLVGSRRPEQTRENIDCLTFSLDAGHLERLDRISRIEMGFPHRFLRQDMIAGMLQNKLA